MNTQQITFTIQGMRSECAKCAVTIEQALTRMDGVITAQVNYATERATVLFAPTRVSVAKIVGVVQNAGFQISQERIVLNVQDLVYASSTQTIERVVSQVENVIQVHVDLATQQIAVDALAGHVNIANYKQALGKLGLRIVEQPSSNILRQFAIRTFLISAFAVLGLFSAGAHAGVFEAGFLHTPLSVMTLAVLIAYGIGWRFYHVAFETALLRGEFDLGVVLALVASASLFCGLPMTVIAPQSLFATSGFIFAILLTAVWFIVRGLQIWVASQNSPSSQSTLGITPQARHH